MEKQIRKKPSLIYKFDFILLHFVPLAMIWTGVTLFDWFVCISLYWVRMFFVTGGYHRYFSHRTYRTSRAFQFFLAFMAQTSAQKGALWWAAHHRHHHKHSDQPEDPHSMKLYGFWYSHVGWFLSPEFQNTEFKAIRDFAKYPELIWLNRFYLIPPVILGALVFLLGGYINGGSLATVFTHGWSTLVVGFALSTVILWHGTFSINSIMHKFGKPRYDTGDESKNSLWLALVTLGEGWHNNHHYYTSTARQGFYWWEIDPTYYILKMLSWVRIIWDIREVPPHIKYSRTKEEARQLLAKGVFLK